MHACTHMRDQLCEEFERSLAGTCNNCAERRTCLFRQACDLVDCGRQFQGEQQRECAVQYILGRECDASSNCRTARPANRAAQDANARKRRGPCARADGGAAAAKHGDEVAICSAGVPGSRDCESRCVRTKRARTSRQTKAEANRCATVTLLLEE